MTESQPRPDGLSAYLGREVVVDVISEFVFVGTLVGEDDRYMILDNADVHDLRDTRTNRELYVLDSRIHGPRVNRRRGLVARNQVVCLSLLEDVIE